MRYQPRQLQRHQRRRRDRDVRDAGEAAYVGTLEADLLLGDVHSLKQKRSVVRPVVAELRRRFDVAVAEAGHLDLHRRTLVGVVTVASDARRVGEVLDRCERWLAARPEVELLAVRRRLIGDQEEL